MGLVVKITATDCAQISRKNSLQTTNTRMLTSTYRNTKQTNSTQYTLLH